MRHTAHPEPAYIPTEYLMCRNDHHHQWEAKVVLVVEYTGIGDVYEGEFICRRCKLPKTEWVDPTTGERLRAPAYGYSAIKGYLFDAPIEDRKAFNREVRKEVFWRLAYDGKPKKKRGDK
jgi:hypothetical protein